MTKPVLNWRFVQNWTVAGNCHTMYRDDALGVQFERHPRGRAYFRDGDPREYKTAADLIEALELADLGIANCNGCPTERTCGIPLNQRGDLRCGEGA